MGWIRDNERFLASVALPLTIGVIVWAGLWPFDFARSNGVTWLDSGPGLGFSRFGIAHSQAELDLGKPNGFTGVTIEMWVRVHRASDDLPRAWFAFVDDSQLSPIGFRQEGADLVVWDIVTNPDFERWFNDFRAPDVLRPGALQHIAITSALGKPKVYVDGALVDTSEGFGIPLIGEGESLGGTLALGSGPPWDIGWQGDIFGLAIYDIEIDSESIQHHASLLPRLGDLESLAESSDIQALYIFAQEYKSRTIYDISGVGNHLILLDYFQVPKREILALPDGDDLLTLWNGIDVSLNLLGFTCFGFIFSLAIGIERFRFATIILATFAGFSLSLGIELTQVLMVNRNSSLQDLILNTVGTLAGCWVFLVTLGAKEH
jgi:hypothetical protein